MAISVVCSCGAWFKTNAENAGRAATCPKCGRPLTADAPTARLDAPEPVPTNIRGSEESPSPNLTHPRGSPKYELKHTMVKRPFAGSSVGVSLLTVAAVVVLGWRIYGVTHRVNRAVPATNAAAEPAPADEMDRAAEQLVKDPRTAEAREWLDAAKHPNHVILEMGDEQARIMIEGFYDRGAQGVYVLKPSTLGDSVVTSQIAVKLPADPDMRQDCLTWAAPFLDTDGPVPDEGQTYVMVPTD